VASGTTGCGGTKHMKPVDPAGMSAMYDSINPNEAAIVFFRPWGFMGSALNPGIVEVDESGNLKFVAIMPNGTRYIHRTTPGKHTYFWSSVSLHGGLVSCILVADMEAGKTYYTAAFGSKDFTPVTDTSDETFVKNLNSCSWIENTPDGQIWFNGNLPSLQNKYTQAIGKGAMLIKPEYGTITSVR
ncbi:MAG: DUF2846 domain-containing protein, partial [Deltaproteobacteria bacterium]|nr:DUF2846 domain-containing protein [Deltaproteobacteria bacterium]